MMTQVFTARVCRRTVSFSKHAVDQYHARVRPDLTRKQAREDLKAHLRDDVKIARGTPDGISPSAWSRARTKEYIVGPGFVAPLSRTAEGVWYAATVMVPDGAKPLAGCAR